MLLLAALGIGVPLSPTEDISPEALALARQLDAIMKGGCTACMPATPDTRSVNLLASGELERGAEGAQMLRAAQFVADMHVTLPAIAAKLAAATHTEVNYVPP